MAVSCDLCNIFQQIFQSFPNGDDLWEGGNKNYKISILEAKTVGRHELGQADFFGYWGGSPAVSTLPVSQDIHCNLCFLANGSRISRKCPKSLKFSPVLIFSILSIHQSPFLFSANLDQFC